MNKIDLDFFSLTLQTNINIHIALPYPFFDKDNCKVIWAFHPYFSSGKFYFDQLGLASYVDTKNICLVCPDIGNNYYINNEFLNIGDFIENELFPYVDKFLDAIFSNQSEKHVLGISMGAFGALNLALAKKDYFKCVHLISGSYDLNAPSDERLKTSRIQKNISRLVSSSVKRYFSEDDLKNNNLHERFSPNSLSSKVDIYCGNSDYLSLNQSELLFKTLQSNSIHTSLNLSDGEHDVCYWKKVCNSIFDNF